MPGPSEPIERGKVVAALVAPNLPPKAARRRTLLPEYAAFLKRRKPSGVLRALDAVRERVGFVEAEVCRDAQTVLVGRYACRPGRHG